MTAHPWERVSARAIADHAGVDPALVTYHFGGRAGLVAAVAEKATAILRSQMTLGYASENDVERAIQRAVQDPVAVMAKAPLLAQLYVSELLLHGDDRTDSLLFEMARPYFADIDKVVDAATRSRELRRVDGAVLLQTIAAVSLFPFFLGPLNRRHGRVPPPADLERLAGEMVGYILHGVTAGSAPRRARRSAKGRTQQPTAGGPTRDDLVAAAIELLRSDIDGEFSIARVAAFAGVEPRVVAAQFDDADSLAVAVARAAVRQLPRSDQGSRTRGRPAVQNPAAESDLIAAATELITAQSGRITANAVATRAGCDPALVTYYFGGRGGLLQAVAANTLRDLVSRFQDGYDSALPVRLRLTQALREPVAALTSTPSLAQFLVDEFLVHGTKSTDAALAKVVAPFLATIRECVEEGLASGELRDGNRESLLYGVGILPLYLAAVLPVFERALTGSELKAEPSVVPDEILGLTLTGVRAEARRRSSAGSLAA